MGAANRLCDTSPDVCGIALRRIARVSLDDPPCSPLQSIEQRKEWILPALHLGRAEGCDAFATVDRQFIRTAKAVGVKNVRAPGA